MFILIVVIVLALSISLLLVIFRELPVIFNNAKPLKEATVERLEKACDAVFTLLAFLIPGTLVVTTWVYEKTHSSSYGAWLALSTFWFLVVLASTMYMRFNFVWG